MFERTKATAFMSACLLIVVAAAATTAQSVYPMGTTIWKPLQARNGFTFISAPDGTARLVNMRGDLVNTWALSGDSLLVKMPILSAPGHILAFRGPIPIPFYGRPRGSYISELDYNGNIVWEYTPGSTIDIFPFGGFHHDMSRLANGNTLAMASVLVDGSGISAKTLVDDCLLEISPAGQIVWAWYTFQHFDEFEFTAATKALIYESGGDWAHANAVTVVPPNTLGDSRFTPGNLIVSYRDLNTVIVIDRNTGNIVWKAGPNGHLTIGQHYPYMIPLGLPGAGRILAFDNGGAGGYPEVFRNFSRVVEIDPLTNTLPWTYSAADSGFQNWSFFTPFISNAQRLAGGNTLVVEGTKGRIFEVTAAGAIVWEYMSPFSESRMDGGKPVVDQNIYRAFRLPLYWPLLGAASESE